VFQDQGDPIVILQPWGPCFEFGLLFVCSGKGHVVILVKIGWATFLADFGDHWAILSQNHLVILFKMTRKAKKN
jgi:hypothetical protein